MKMLKAIMLIGFLILSVGLAQAKVASKCASSQKLRSPNNKGCLFRNEIKGSCAKGAKCQHKASVKTAAVVQKKSSAILNNCKGSANCKQSLLNSLQAEIKKANLAQAKKISLEKQIKTLEDGRQVSQVQLNKTILSLKASIGGGWPTSYSYAKWIVNNNKYLLRYSSYDKQIYYQYANLVNAYRLHGAAQTSYTRAQKSLQRSLNDNQMQLNQANLNAAAYHQAIKGYDQLQVNLRQQGAEVVSGINQTGGDKLRLRYPKNKKQH